MSHSICRTWTGLRMTASPSPHPAAHVAQRAQGLRPSPAQHTHSFASVDVTAFHSICPDNLLLHGCEQFLNVWSVKLVVKPFKKFHFSRHVVSDRQDPPGSVLPFLHASLPHCHGFVAFCLSARRYFPKSQNDFPDELLRAVVSDAFCRD